MQNIIKMCVASASELIQHSELYMTVKAVLFTTPSANLNGVRCTEAFIDNIIANQEAYVGLPLNADIHSLESGQYNKLGHMFDQKTGTFATAIIGSFYKFEKEQLPNGEKALIGYARIMKRNKAVCSAVGELFASGNLKFSFEISCGEYTQLEDGTMLIDASENNYLEGMCIVWSPACPIAVAKELVAELNNDRKEADIAMNEEAKAAEIVAEEVKAEEVETEEVDENSSDVQTEAVTEEVVAEDKSADENTKSDNTQTEQAETGEVSAEAERAEDENAAEKSENASEEKGEEAEEENAACGKKKCGEDESKNEVAAETEVKPESNVEFNVDTLIAQMQQISEAIQALKLEIAELKETKEQEVQPTEEVVAETITETEEEKREEAPKGEEPKEDIDPSVNPFMAEISLPETHKYSLLEKVEKPAAYSLLEKF